MEAITVLLLQASFLILVLTYVEDCREQRLLGKRDILCFNSRL